MFCVTGAETAAIRAMVFENGELAAAIELHRLFPSIVDNAQAQLHARVIAGWQPLPAQPMTGVVLNLRAFNWH